jgi:hypothetical protein
MDLDSLPDGLYATDDVDGGSDRGITIVVGTTDVDAQDFGEVTALLTGVVEDTNSTPIPDVELTLVDSAGVEFGTLTGADGVYVFEGVMDSAPLTAGPATLTAVLSNGQTVTLNIVISGAPVDVENIVFAIEAPPALAFTGRDALRYVWPASLMLFMGLVLVAGTRRRRKEVKVTTD